jgi:hypothetical protein
MSGATSGVISTQKECRDSLPPADNNVKNAEAKPKGTAPAIAKKQTKDGVN